MNALKTSRLPDGSWSAWIAPRQSGSEVEAAGRTESGALFALSARLADLARQAGARGTEVERSVHLARIDSGECITPTGLTDQHMSFIHKVDGQIVCAFCNRK